MTLQTPCYFSYLSLSNETPHLPLYFTRILPFPSLLLPHPCTGPAPPPMHRSCLLSWFLQLLQVLNSHLEIWSQEPQMRGLFSLHIYPDRPWVRLSVSSLSGVRSLKQNFPSLASDNTMMYAQRCRAEM